MRSSRLVLIAAVLLLLSSVVDAGQSSKGEKAFHEAGYPTMALLTGVALLAGAVFFGISRGGDDIKGSSSVLGGAFMGLNIANAIMGIFLVFGPGGSGLGGVRCNILGLQVMCAAAIGFYLIYTNSRPHAVALSIIVLVTILSLVGCMPLLNHSSPIFSLSQSDCFTFFMATSADYNRCDDQGYLQLLRTFGMFLIATLLVQLSILFGALTDGCEVLGATGASRSSRSDARAPLVSSGFGEQAYAPAAPAQQHSRAHSHSVAQPAAHPVIPQPYAVPATDSAPQVTGYQAL